MAREPDPRSPTSAGLEWGTRVTAIGMEFAVPAALGAGLDRWLGTAPWLTLAGAVAGMAIGTLRIIRLPAELASAAERRGRDREGRPPAGAG